jgi:long-subunit acyl-CoA synthetase (AMP-forming)
MAETLVGAFHALASSAPGVPAVLEKRYGRWVERTRGEIAADAAKIAGGLAAQGVGPGDAVALMVLPRLEWIALDLAVQATGARALAIPARFRPTDVARLVDMSGATTIIVEGQDEADIVLTAVEAGDLRSVARVIFIEAAGVSEYTSDLLLSLDDVRMDGADLGAFSERLDSGIAAVAAPSYDAQRLNEVSHATLVQAAQSTISAFSLGAKDRVVAARDMADPIERGATIYPALLSGALLALPESPATTDAAIHEIAPTYIHLTERWLTRKAARITVRFDENRGVKSWLAASWRKRTGSTLENYGSGKPPRGLWRFMVSIPVLEELGLEKARAVVVSGDPSPRELLGFYTALGLPVLAALGLPELAGFATVGSPGASDGWVGQPAPGVTVALDDSHLVVTTQATGRIDTALAAEALDDGFVVNGSSPEEASETRLRSIPVFSTAIVSPGASSVVIELDGAIASRWSTKNELDAATYRSFSLLPELREGVRTAVTNVLGRFDLTPGTITILSAPLDDVPGALSFGDVVRRDLVST